MGCDIHLHAEVLIDAVWHHYGLIDIRRNYELFGKMAGVRGGQQIVATNPGLPDDVTLLTRMDSEWWGGHTTGWMSWDMIKSLAFAYGDDDNDEFSDIFGYCFNAGWTESPDPRIADVRWVFWFDS